MSETMGLVRQGRLRKGETAAARRIAKAHGAWFVSGSWPGAGPKSWFAAPNMGNPFDRDRFDAIARDMEAAGFPR